MTSHLPLVRIRTDHGFEFENSQFLKFCEEMGIKHEFSAPITPQQNGVMKKKYRVLVEKVRNHHVNIDDFAASTEMALDEDGLLSSMLEGESSGLDLVVDLSTFSKSVDQSTLDNSILVDLDADWAGCSDDRKSTSGEVFYVGNNLVALHSKKQNSISLSTTEAEYVAAGSCCTQLLWMR
ncbi:unnamed protein product [Prunus armeniaca]